MIWLILIEIALSLYTQLSYIGDILEPLNNSYIIAQFQMYAKRRCLFLFIFI
jgi:hypothetical protein